MDEYLSFRKMITPLFIQIIFWVGAGLCVLFGLVGVVSGMSSSFGGAAQVLMGLLTMVFGPVVVRIYCELLILLFKIYDTLQDIRGRMSASASPAAGAGLPL